MRYLQSIFLQVIPVHKNWDKINHRKHNQYCVASAQARSPH